LDILLSKLAKSVKHLQIIDRVFAKEEYEDKLLYLEIRKKITDLNRKNKCLLSDELYVGGKKAGKNGYGRQMILSDVITYILAGRGYFYATRSQKCMESFIEMTLHLINQLMIFDSLTVNPELRKKVIKELETGIGKDFCKDEDRCVENRALKVYSGPIGLPLEKFEPSARVLELLSADKTVVEKRLSNWFDSLLPKELGLWGELIVYVYLLRQKIGYVWPMLLNQDLISGYWDNVLKVPDFAIIPFNIEEKVIGVEVGGGKETQSTKFSHLTGITIATKANTDNPKRCPICGKWLLFCPWVINQFCDQSVLITKPSEAVRCLEKCTLYKPEDIMQGNCPYASVKGVKPEKHVMHFEYNPTGYHFHLKCALKDQQASKSITKKNIVTYYPYISGLEEIEHLLTEDKTYKIEQLEKKVKQLEKELAKHKAT